MHCIIEVCRHGINPHTGHSTGVIRFWIGDPAIPASEGSEPFGLHSNCWENVRHAMGFVVTHAIACGATTVQFLDL